MSSELLSELSSQYASLQKRRHVAVSLDDLDNAFFIRDHILGAGFVSASVSRQLCARISDVFMSWNGYLHGLVMPDAHNLIQTNESKVLDASQKKNILSLLGKSMVFVNANSLFHITPDENAEAVFIDESFAFWQSSYRPVLTSVLSVIQARWKG